jgi:replicative DNA helicase
VSDLSQIMPSDIEAEQAVLGSMMMSPSALADCAEILTAGDFLRPAHREIFAAVMAMADRGEHADVLSVRTELERRGTLPKTGGALYLHDLLTAVPTVAQAAFYAGKVRECAVSLRLAEGGQAITAAAVNPGLDVAEKVDAAYRVLDEAAGNATPPRAVSVADLIGPALEVIEAGPDVRQGIPSGWADLDRLIAGFRGGEMITVGARPGAGKTVVLLNVAVQGAVRLGVPVLACSLEMSRQECAERMIAFTGGVDLGRIRSRALEESDWERIAVAHTRLSGAPDLMLSDDPYTSVQSIRADLRAMRRAGTPAQLVVVDYLQLMTSRGRPENRQQEVSAISRGLKLLAKEFDVPVLVGSQLNRGPEQRSDKRPMLADLRESGSVEQDSDVVILLYREDMYEQETPRAGEIDLIVAKNRQGPTGTATLAFRGHQAMCADMYRDPASSSSSSASSRTAA